MYLLRYIILILFIFVIFLVLYLFVLIYKYLCSKYEKNQILTNILDKIKYHNNKIFNKNKDKQKVNMSYLFCYGSNSIQQIKDRLKIKRELKYFPAYIKNYTRIFAGKSKKWNNGGVATIYPIQNATVYGIVVKLKEEELLKLDEFEGGYVRIILDGKMQNFELNKIKTLQFNVYVKTKFEFKEFPSIDYLNAINNMILDRHIDKKYDDKKILIKGIIKNNLINMGYWSKIDGIKLFEKT